jgi:UDP-N-acetylglucosamine acyltransferase
MVFTHVAHDCQVGSGIVFGNNATLAGHVQVHDFVVISAFTSIHQFLRVGRFAFLGAYSVVIKDAMPFAKTNGAKPVNLAVNSIGLKRRGIEGDALRHIQRAWRILVRSNLNTKQAIEAIRAELPIDDPNIAYLLDFFATSKRGVYTAPPGGRRGGAGEEGEDV